MESISTPSSSSSDSGHSEEYRPRVRPRSQAVYKHIPGLSELGYEEFYKHAAFLMRKAKEEGQESKERVSVNEELLFTEGTGNQVKVKFREARQSVASVAFAS